MSNSNSSSGGIGFVGLLTIVFIVLKLTGVIAWSWLWVLAPIWISAAFVIAVLACIGVVVLVVWLRDKARTKRWMRERETRNIAHGNSRRI